MNHSYFYNALKQIISELNVRFDFKKVLNLSKGLDIKFAFAGFFRKPTKENIIT